MSDRPPVMLIHGFLGTVRDWDWVLDSALLRRDIFLPELSLESFTDTVETLLRTMQAPVFDVGGYSMGGRLTYGVLARAPQRVRRFVALGARAEQDFEERAARDEAWARLLEDEGLEAFVDAWYAQPLFERFRSGENYDEHRAYRIEHNDADWLARQIRLMSPARQPDFREVLQRTERPGLLIAGGLDTFYVEQNDALADANPNLRAAVIPGAGHALLAEAPDEVAALVDDFLA